MIFDAWVYGELELPKENFTKWLSHPLGPEARGPDFIIDDSGCVGFEPLVILESLHRLELKDTEFLGVGADFGKVSVRGLLGDTAVLHSQGLLTGLFASAAAHGGDGRIVVVGRRGTTFGYEVQIVCGAISARALTENERLSFLDSRAALELRTLEATNRRAAMTIPDPGPTAPQWRRLPELPATPQRPSMPVPAQSPETPAAN